MLVNIRRTPKIRLKTENSTRKAFEELPEQCIEDGIAGSFGILFGDFKEVIGSIPFGKTEALPAIYTFSGSTVFEDIDPDYLKFFCSQVSKVFSPSALVVGLFTPSDDFANCGTILRVLVATDFEYQKKGKLDLGGPLIQAIKDKLLSLDSICVSRRPLAKGSDNRVFVPTMNRNCWKRLLADPEKHWREGYSAMSLADSWEQAKKSKDGLPKKISRAIRNTPLGVSGLDLLIAIPERDTPMPGKGLPSATDLFCLARNGVGETISMAVEGKVLEPFDSLISKWLKAGKSPGSPANRLKRITDICGLLGCQMNQDAENLYYQLFHRTAAAVLEAKRFNCRHALMLVHSFDRTKPPVHFQAFKEFALYLGADEEEVRPNTVFSIADLKGGIRLWLGWVSDSVEHPKQ